jgi:Tfp pilus assembly pilus retraction ATPase PilT
MFKEKAIKELRVMHDNNPYSNINIESGIFTVDDFNKILGDIESEQAFDDINLVCERLIVVKSMGKVYRVGSTVLTTSEVEFISTLIGKGNNVPSDVRAGKQLDPSYQFTFDEKIVYRYRVNVSGLRGITGQDLKISMRSIKSEIPTLEYVRFSESDFNYIINGAGLVIMSGETGSGKTTTVAGVLGHLIRNSVKLDLHRIVSCYEQPTEYMFQPLIDKVMKDAGCNVEVYQHEIGMDLDDFTEGTKNAFRSNPDIIFLGEARDLPTIKAALVLAQSGHMVIITTHAKGVVNTISRLVSSFREEEQGAALKGFLTSTKMIISQELIVEEKGRVPVRESVVVSNIAQRDFGVINTSELMSSFGEYFGKHGSTFMDHAHSLLGEGSISDDTHASFIQRESYNAG